MNVRDGAYYKTCYPDRILVMPSNNEDEVGHPPHKFNKGFNDMTVSLCNIDDLPYLSSIKDDEYYWTVEIPDDVEVKYHTTCLYVHVQNIILKEKHKVADMEIWKTIDKTDIMHKNPFAIKYMDISEPIIMKALEQNAAVLEVVEKENMFEKIGFKPKSVKVENICLDILKRNMSVFKYINHKSYKICKAALEYNIEYLADIKNPSDKILELAFSISKRSINHIKQTENICLKAISINPGTLKYIEDQTKEMCIKAVKLNAETLKYVRYEFRILEVFLAAVQNDGMALRYVLDDFNCGHSLERDFDDPQAFKDKYDITIEEYATLCSEAIKTNPDAFEFAHIQTEDMCKIAVKENFENLKFVKNKTEELCLLAVSINNRALDYICCDPTVYACKYGYYYGSKGYGIFHVTYKILIEAVKKDFKALQYLKFLKEEITHEQYYDIFNLGIKNNGCSIAYIEKEKLSTEEYYKLCLDAVRNNAASLQYISQHTEELYMEALQCKWNNSVLSFIKPKSETSCGLTHNLALKLAEKYKTTKGINLDNLNEFYKDEYDTCTRNMSYEDYIIMRINEIHMAIIQKSGHELQYVKHQTDKLCMAAVKQNGCALKFVKNQTEEICDAAVKQNYNALQSIKDKTIKDKCFNKYG
jgi:hypothetical protein